MMWPQNRPITGQIVKVVHDHGHKQVNDLQKTTYMARSNRERSTIYDLRQKDLGVERTRMSPKIHNFKCDFLQAQSFLVTCQQNI